MTALEGRRFVDAIKLLRKSGLGLKEAKASAEEYLGRLAASAKHEIPSVHKAGSMARPPSSTGQIETEDEYSAHKSANAHFQHRLAGKNGPRLAPGEVPKSDSVVWLILAIALGALLYYCWR